MRGCRTGCFCVVCDFVSLCSLFVAAVIFLSSSYPTLHPRHHRYAAVLRLHLLRAAAAAAPRLLLLPACACSCRARRRNDGRARCAATTAGSRKVGAVCYRRGATSQVRSHAFAPTDAAHEGSIDGSTGARHCGQFCPAHCYAARVCLLLLFIAHLSFTFCL